MSEGNNPVEPAALTADELAQIVALARAEYEYIRDAQSAISFIEEHVALLLARDGGTHERRRCQTCNAPRKGEACHKCGAPTFVPHPSWEDPKLPPVDRIRELAREVGYAIAEHGTKERDLDLIAAPWSDDAVDYFTLMCHIAEGLGGIVVEVEGKPLGRRAATIQMDGYYKPIDISVCPQIRGTPHDH